MTVIYLADSFRDFQQDFLRFNLTYFTIGQGEYKSFYGFNGGVIFPP